MNEIPPAVLLDLLSGKGLGVEYQPITATADGRLLGHEALAAVGNISRLAVIRVVVIVVRMLSPVILGALLAPRCASSEDGAKTRS